MEALRTYGTLIADWGGDLRQTQYAYRNPRAITVNPSVTRRSQTAHQYVPVWEVVGGGRGHVGDPWANCNAGACCNRREATFSGTPDVIIVWNLCKSPRN